MAPGESTSTPRSDPCRAFGHTGGRDKRTRLGGSGTCTECRRLYQAIRRGMVYWFQRIMLGQSGRTATAVSRLRSMEMTRVYESRSDRRRYRALRAQGLTWDQALARMSGITSENVRAIQRRVRRRNRARWGGEPKIGSRAWVRREQYKLAKKMGLVA